MLWRWEACLLSDKLRIYSSEQPKKGDIQKADGKEY